MEEQVIRELARRYATPSYVFDTDCFGRRIRRLKELWGSRVEICYAMKANSFLTEAAAVWADQLEVCSDGEYEICRRLKVPSEKIVLSGVSKTEEEMKRVMSCHGAGIYTAESLRQLQLLERCAAGLHLCQLPVLLRLTSGNQFGMDQQVLEQIIIHLNRYTHLDIHGIQYYSGTQKKKFDKIGRELKKLDELCRLLEETYGFEVKCLEYGPGFPAVYFQGEESEEENFPDFFQTALSGMAYKGKIRLELGRYLAAPCGSYVTRVVDTKENEGQNYCIVDGGINHVNYYGQTMAMKVPEHVYLPADQTDKKTQPEAEEAKLWMVCGSLCTSGDVLMKQVPITGAGPGGIFEFKNIGAYSVTEGIYLFLSRKLPRVLLYSREQGFCLVRDFVSTDQWNARPADITIRNQNKGE